MRLVWTAPAERDLHAILHYYGEIDPDLAAERDDRVTAVPDMLLDHPHIGSPIEGSRNRKLRMRNTPFLLIYRVRKKVIEILRTVHVASDWRKA